MVVEPASAVDANLQCCFLCALCSTLSHNRRCKKRQEIWWTQSFGWSLQWDLLCLHALQKLAGEFSGFLTGNHVGKFDGFFQTYKVKVQNFLENLGAFRKKKKRNFRNSNKTFVPTSFCRPASLRICNHVRTWVRF